MHLRIRSRNHVFRAVCERAHCLIAKSKANDLSVQLVNSPYSKYDEKDEPGIRCWLVLLNITGIINCLLLGQEIGCCFLTKPLFIQFLQLGLLLNHVQVDLSSVVDVRLRVKSLKITLRLLPCFRDWDVIVIII